MIVTVTLGQGSVDRLLDVAREHPICIDLRKMIVTTPLGDSFAFELDPFRRECLMEGVDEIALTLASEPAIRAYELRTGLG
jgi:3-isopropylmalate/(R)-2-methylmalate dehydratase small subunit